MDALSPRLQHTIWNFSDPAHTIWWVAETFPWNIAKFGIENVNGGQNICSRDTSAGNGKHFEKQAQSSKG